MERAKLNRRPPTEAMKATQFKPGNPGRPKGSRNARVVSQKALSQIIDIGMARVGENGKGKGGILGYVTSAVRKYPDKVLAIRARLEAAQTVAGARGVAEPVTYRGIDEVLADMHKRGITAEQLHRYADMMAHYEAHGTAAKMIDCYTVLPPPQTAADYLARQRHQQNALNQQKPSGVPGNGHASHGQGNGTART